MTPETFVSRLEGVRQLRPGRWVCQCPAHEDKSPSLSVTVKDDGSPLFHCHAGCHPDDILGALGLSWHNILPERDKAAYEAALAAGHRHRQRTLADVTLKEWSAWVMAIAAADLREGREHGLEDRAVLSWAVAIAQGGCQHG